jgi:copper chaperone
MIQTPFTDLGLSQKNAGNDAEGGCCGGGSCACNSDAAPAGATAESLTKPAVSADYLVSGMTCSHCVSSVTEELSDLADVQAVTVELNPTGASTVTISSAVPLSDVDVRAAITEAGYSLVSAAR